MSAIGSRSYCSSNSAAQSYQICHSEERSDVGISQYLAGSWESDRQNRNCLPEIATGAKRPRNDKSGAISILTIVCSGRQRTAGSGMPLPYKIEKSRQETRRDADYQKNLPSRKFRREEKCERKPSGCPFAFDHPPQRQNCKILLQNFILQF